MEYKGKSLLILGAGGHGKVVAEIATDLGFVKIDFLDDNSPEAIGSVQDLPELGRDYDYIFYDQRNHGCHRRWCDGISF